jgi:hypothetical protein
MAHDVFVSYSAKDKPTADAVVATLEANGIRCWIAPRDVMAGMHYGEAIIDALTASKVMILVFSKNANESSQIRLEVERAVSKGITIIPVRIEDVAPGKSLEYFIGPVHWLDALTPPLERHLEQLASTIHVLLARTAATGEGVAAEPAPAVPPAPPRPAPSAQAAPTPPMRPTAAPATAAVAAPPASASLPIPTRRPLPKMPALPRLTGAALRRFLIPAAGLALILVLVLVWRSVSAARATPQIVGIEFPKTILANGVNVEGHVAFQDPNGDLQTAEFEVLEAVNFKPAKFTPNNVEGIKDGKFTILIRSQQPQRVTQRVTLVDRAGHRSRPLSFTFEALPAPKPSVRAMRVARKDEVRDNRKGVAFHVYLEVSNVKGKELVAVATIYEQVGGPLSPRTPQFSFGGSLAHSVRLTPRYDETRFEDVALFIPFDQFPVIPGTTPYRAKIQILDGEVEIGSALWEAFVLTRPR